MNLPRFGPQFSLTRVEPLLAKAETLTQQLEAQKEKLHADMSVAELDALLTTYEQLSVSMGLAEDTIDILFSVDMNNDEVRTAKNNANRITTDISNRMLFFSLTIKQWSAQRLLHYSDALPRYRGWLRRLAAHAPHTLSEAEERIILYKDNTGDHLLKQVYDMITNNYMYTVTLEGKTETLTRSELSRYYHHPDRAVRKAASEALIVPFEKDHAVLGELYRGIVEDFDVETLKLRNYDEPIAARHLGNSIPAAAYTALNTVVERNRTVFREYITLKQKALGYKDFTRFDFTAPVQGAPQHIEYAAAKERVLNTFRSFAPWMADGAQRVFDEQCIDVPPRAGKRSGACCYGLVPGETPVVILNFTGTYDDLFTMAHELGHAIHDMMAAEQSPLVFSPPLVLAESASTFGETLLFHTELKKANKQERIALLCQRLDDLLGTIMVQMRFTRFEAEAHALLEAGGSVQELDTLWVQLAQDDFPDIEFPKTSVQWSTIPHIHHSPFYCYSYAFGMLFVLVLWRRYEEEGAAFVPKFKKLLAAGGSQEPAALLQALGYDITTDAFWEDGFAVIQQHVDELHSLLG
jgi:oligoendopeptidase F